MYAETQYIADAIEAGARGFLLKNTNREELVRAITLVREGHTYYTPKMSDKIVALAARTHFYPLIPADKPSFSKMELQVMQLICKQQSSKEIAHQLRISQRTVEGTRERLQKKTGSQNMIGIALYAIKNGIFTLD
jgi:DNA-binding NarL/FixJ family response regulator